MLETIKNAALQAGRAIMDIYGRADSTWQVERKPDNSPLTLADRESHRIIARSLGRTGIPLLSEEGAHSPYATRCKWDRLWVVDPLDGTKEFLKRNGEFTVNIALVEDGHPVMGVIFAPARLRLWWGARDAGAFTASVSEGQDVDGTMTYIVGKSRTLPLKARMPGQPLRVVASRSHLSSETEAFIETLCAKYGEVQTVNAGSSLKICLVAEGNADIYPRLAPTMEWDTAAGHAIALAAGCTVSSATDGQPLTYNKEDLHNPFFIVIRKTGDFPQR